MKYAWASAGVSAILFDVFSGKLLSTPNPDGYLTYLGLYFIINVVLFFMWINPNDLK
jgi:hypothetical protein